MNVITLSSTHTYIHTFKHTHTDWPFSTGISKIESGNIKLVKLYNSDYEFHIQAQYTLFPLVINYQNRRLATRYFSKLKPRSKKLRNKQTRCRLSQDRYRGSSFYLIGEWTLYHFQDGVVAIHKFRGESWGNSDKDRSFIINMRFAI